MIELKKDTSFYVYVGVYPNSSNGWNGGRSVNLPGAGGGINKWNTSKHMLSRLIVTGGGGGSSITQYAEWQSGSGGSLNGENCNENQIEGVTQTNRYKFGIGESNTVNDHNSGG